MTVNEIGYQIGYENDIKDDFQEDIRGLMGNNPYADTKHYDSVVKALKEFFDSLDMKIPEILTDTFDPKFRGYVEEFLSGIHNGGVAKLRENRQK